MIRAALTTALALCLLLTSLSAGVAQVRMAAAGGYCGTGAPQILLDASGLPILDADGHALAAPDCPTCVLTVAIDTAPGTMAPARTLRPVPFQPIPFPVRLDQSAHAPQARAPPVAV